MSPRHRRLILLLSSAGFAAALLCLPGTAGTGPNLGPLVSAAPPLVTGTISPAGDDSPLIAALRREADQALGQLRARQTP